MVESDASDAMIQADGLCKYYGTFIAIEDISFRVPRGEVVAFLGPNGAGKSTTMKILTGYLAPSAGTARIAGFDMATERIAGAERLGYLPENGPLYPDMTPRSLLEFFADARGLSGSQRDERIEAVIGQCELGSVIGKAIGKLSKGYRQRVGLADALVHEPDLVILDEPTIGLDPHQIRSVRQLIKGLAREHTVLISTHILSEAELTCSQVLILHEGRIQAADTTENLQALLGGGTQVVAEIAAPEADLRLCWEQLAEVRHFDVAPAEGAYWRCALVAQPGADLRPLVFEQVRQRGWALRELSRQRVTLEDVFVQVTRSRPEDEEGL